MGIAAMDCVEMLEGCSRENKVLRAILKALYNTPPQIDTLLYRNVRRKVRAGAVGKRKRRTLPSLVILKPLNIFRKNRGNDGGKPKPDPPEPEPPKPDKKTPPPKPDKKGGREPQEPWEPKTKKTKK